MPRLLIVDPEDGATIRALLMEHGFEANIAASVDEALVGLEQLQPHLVVLDHAMTESGMVLFSKLNGLPTVVCSRVDSINDRVACLKLGADDFVSKPFEPYELIERISAVLRRSSRTAPWPERDANKIDLGDLTVARKSAQVLVRDEEVHLTPIEFYIVVLLAEHVNEVVTAEAIGEEIWGVNMNVGHTITVHIGRIRQKFERAGLRRPRIVTVRTRGYCLVLKGEPSS